MAAIIRALKAKFISVSLTEWERLSMSMNVSISQAAVASAMSQPGSEEGRKNIPLRENQ
jgi:hypothetical protein